MGLVPDVGFVVNKVMDALAGFSVSSLFQFPHTNHHSITACIYHNPIGSTGMATQYVIKLGIQVG
jgi:hypothetical protein